MTRIETVSEQHPEIFRINVNGYLTDGFSLVSAGKSPDTENACGNWWAIVKIEDKDNGEV